MTDKPSVSQMVREALDHLGADYIMETKIREHLQTKYGHVFEQDSTTFLNDQDVPHILPGDVLMDSTSLEDAFSFIHSVPSLLPEKYLLPSLIQLVQAIVIHERILVEPGSYEENIMGMGGLSRYIDDSNLGDLVKPVPLNDLEWLHFLGLAKKRSKEISIVLPSNLLDDLFQHEYAFLESPRTVRYRTVVAEPDEDAKQRILLKAITWRAYLYFAISCYKGVPYLPNVFRAPLIEHELRTGLFYKKAADAAMKAVEKAAGSFLDERNQLLGQQLFELRFPPIFRYILSKVNKNWTDVIAFALELRGTPEAQAFRKLCTAIDQATDKGDLNLLGETIDEMRLRSKTWLKEIEAPSVDVGIAFPLGIEFDPLGIWKYVKSRRKRHLIFLDKLFQASI